jgi:glycosyltransferase involved in cell wall biosynthesis
VPVDHRAPLVSIVVPFYSTYARYLPACLASVQRQTYPHWEVVVVDDASPTDDAERIVDALGDTRIRVLRHATNRGQAAGRNTGIRATSGPLVMPMDCDDELAPTHLEKLVAALAERPACGAAYADYELFDAIAGVLRFPARDTRWLLKEQWIPHPGTIVRRDLWAAAHGYSEDEAFRAGNEDWDYFLRLAEVGLEVVHVGEPLYRYRQHGGSITSSQFACADYRMRELMYVRHRPLFDRYGMRCAFLAGGYRVSGKAFWVRGQRLRGLLLLLKSAWLDPSDFAAAVRRSLRRPASNGALAAAAQS